MTQGQQEVYTLLLLTGRTEEAEDYKRGLDSHDTISVPDNH